MRQVTAISVSALLLFVAVQANAELNVVVILDNSGSMSTEMSGGESRMAAAKRSLLSVLEQTPDDARVGVVLLNPPKLNDDWLIPLGPVDRGATVSVVQSIRAGGPTPLGRAMRLAGDALLASRETQKYGQYKLLLVTDGEATDPRLVDRFLPEVQARGLVVEAIGIDMGEQHSLAMRANTYRNAADPQSLERAISAVVLGESSYDDMDAGETDFEVLEALPGELAIAALSALASPSNAPIGEGEFVPPPARPTPPAPLGGPPAPNQPAPAADDGGFRVPWFVILIAVFMVMRFLRAAKKPR